MKHAQIVPLIGGQTIAMEKVFGSRPEYILSYQNFKSNDSHILNYYNNEVPYHLLDGKATFNLPKVNVVNTTCPCGGLSSLSPTASSDSDTNRWMMLSADYILNEVKPDVFWGENAPRLASKMGEPIVNKLRQYAKKYGYTFSIYKTKSILHGLSQVRDRTFYFFWKGNKIPELESFNRPHEKIEDTIRNVKQSHNDPMYRILANESKPSDDPYYRFLLEFDKKTHKEFAASIDKSINVLDAIEARTDYSVVAKWMEKNKLQRQAEKCMRMYHKLKSGGNIMRKGTEIPKLRLGAFVGHLPTKLTHPDEDRYLNVRECLAIMKMPDHFQLLNAPKTINHICQNVPVTTATDMANQVKKFLGGDLKLMDESFYVQDNRKQNLQGRLI